MGYIDYYGGPVDMEFNTHDVTSPDQIIDLKLNIPQDYKQKCIDEIYKITDGENKFVNLTALNSTNKVWNETKVFDILIDNILKAHSTVRPIQEIGTHYELTYAWSAIYKKGHIAIPHRHLGSYFAFVYYFKSTGNTPIVFDECNFKLNPTDDTLVIFPAHIEHSVPPHNDDEDRICLAGTVSKNSEIGIKEF